MSEVVRLDKIYKSYGKQIALNEINLSLKSGKFYALMGRNGAGKSTLMRILMRYDLPDRGKGTVLGHSLDVDSPDFNLEVALIAESLDYALPMSIGKLFSTISTLHPRWNQSQFDDILRKLRLDPSKRFHQLSRGQKMQVAFAAAVSTRPKLLLLDEITSVLDANARGEFMDYLAGFVRDCGTVIMATNIVTEVHHYADHVILIESGKVSLNLPLDEMTSQFVKIRREPGNRHPLFEDRACVRIGLNSDKSESFIFHGDGVGKFRELMSYRDQRAVTPEEAFIYFMRGWTEDEKSG